MLEGFHRHEIAPRYDIQTIHEDPWHQHSTDITYNFLRKWKPESQDARESWVLNAGSGIYRLKWEGWREVVADLFAAPLHDHLLAVCCDIQQMPFKTSAFHAVVCVGEVLSYCSPSKAISEMRRVLKPGGTLFLDYSSSIGARHWFRESYGRAAHKVTVPYNLKPEQVWVYNPQYIAALLHDNDFTIRSVLGIHGWSSLCERLHVPIPIGVRIEVPLSRFAPLRLADTVIVVAELL